MLRVAAGRGTFPPRSETYGLGPAKEEATGRKDADCREYPSERNGTLAVCADSEAELLEAAVQRAITVHRHQDTLELRNQIRSI